MPVFPGRSRGQWRAGRLRFAAAGYPVQQEAARFGVGVVQRGDDSLGGILLGGSQVDRRRVDGIRSGGNGRLDALPVLSDKTAPQESVCRRAEPDADPGGVVGSARLVDGGQQVGLSFAAEDDGSAGTVIRRSVGAWHQKPLVTMGAGPGQAHLLEDHPPVYQTLQLASRHAGTIQVELFQKCGFLDDFARCGQLLPGEAGGRTHRLQISGVGGAGNGGEPGSW